MTVVRQLVVEPDRDEATVGASVDVRVRDERGRSVEGVVVECGGERAVTDERGRCAIPVRAPGHVKLTAIKAPGERVAYEPAATLVRVLPAGAATKRVRRI